MVAAIFLTTACGSIAVTVDKWYTGSADVSGSIHNDGDACSDPQVTLHLRDHNGAIVRDFSFGAGELAAGQSKDWTTHLVGLLFVDEPVESNVTMIDANAECADRH